MRLTMPSKLDLLREGQAIEFEPGLSGRLNKEKKTLELSNGRVLNVANDRDYFPENQSQVNMSKQREYAEKGAKGPVGEFLHQYTSQGIAGGISDWPSYLTQSGEDYAQRNAANAEVSKRISKESPFISGAATGANIATDLALTRGMSAVKAAPLLAVGSAGSRLATEPENVATEAAFSAAGGKLLDVGGNWASKAASRRAANRALPGQQQAVREANAVQQEEFNFLKQNVKNSNEAKLQQHQTELNARQNRMIDAQNNFEKAKTARDAEVMKLKNQYELAKTTRSAEASRLEAEYKAAKSSADAENKRLQNEFREAQQRYEQSVKDMPRLQAEAQKEYSKNVLQRVEQIEKSFPKGSRIASNELDVPGFVETRLSKTGLAGSTEAAQANRILKSLFPEGETLSSRELASRYKAIEEAIQRANPEVKNILNEFKAHLGEKLPSILSNNMAYERVIPSFVKQLEKDVESVFKKFPQQMTVRPRNEIEKASKASIQKYFNELTPSQFVEKIKNGEFRQEVMEHLFSEGGKQVVNAEGKVIGTKNLPDYVKVMEDMFRNKLDNAIARAELKMIAVETDAAKRLGANVKRTQGLAEPIGAPQPPVPPSPVGQPVPPGELPPVSPFTPPPNLQPPSTPPIPPKPTLAGMPEAPIPMAEPTLPPPQGFAERTGDLMEKNLMGGKDLVNNPITKLAGLKYLLGSAALPAEAAYLGVNALTSPGVGGQVARMTFKQGGIRAIETWAQRYPSFHDGILENPQERRSLTKEIEDASDIPIEQKAILQSKINRGKPIQDKL